MEYPKIIIHDKDELYAYGYFIDYEIYTNWR